MIELLLKMLFRIVFITIIADKAKKAFFRPNVARRAPLIILSLRILFSETQIFLGL